MYPGDFTCSKVCFGGASKAPFRPCTVNTLVLLLLRITSVQTSLVAAMQDQNSTHITCLHHCHEWVHRNIRV